MDEHTQHANAGDATGEASESFGDRSRGGGRRRSREYRVGSLTDMLPEWILPAEGKQHVRAARRELLLAARSMLDSWIERNERGETVRRGTIKIDVE